MTKSEYFKVIRLCSYGNHKVRQNNFGVVWCVRCGRMFGNIEYTKLTESDKIVVI